MKEWSYLFIFYNFFIPPTRVIASHSQYEKYRCEALPPIPAGTLHKEYNADMSTAYFIFHDRLKDFLPKGQRELQIVVKFEGRQSIKHLAESLGAPHPEIGRVQVNGRDESLGSITRDGEQIEIYPVEDGCRVEPRFLLDCHLGRLTAHLRMLGFDCLYQNDYEDSNMADIVQHEGASC